MMNLFLKFLERFTGRKSQRPTMDAYTRSKNADLNELEDLAVRSRLTFREPVKFEPPGPKSKMLLLDDINPETGKPYPDYLERRRKRREARQNKESHAGCPGDVSPD